MIGRTPREFPPASKQPRAKVCTRLLFYRKNGNLHWAVARLVEIENLLDLRNKNTPLPARSIIGLRKAFQHVRFL